MKLTKYFVVAALAASAAACGKLAPKDVELKSANDSLNYAFGLANGEQFAQYYFQNDSTGKMAEEFIKGLQAGLNQKVDTNYADIKQIGEQIGNALSMQEKQGLMGDSTIKANFELILIALRDGMSGADDVMTKDEANQYLDAFVAVKKAEAQKKQEAEMIKQFGKEKQANEAWLAENAKNPNVKVTASGLQYEVLREGTGAKPQATDIVKVDYEGKLINDTTFDSSYKRGEPATFPLNQVIPGWTEGLQLMSVGSKYKLYVPYSLGYGAQGAGQSIPPFATLIFTVELKEIVDPAAQQAAAEPAPAEVEAAPAE